MSKITKFLLIGFTLISAMGSLIACSSTSTPTATNPEQEAIRAYADPAAQTTLQGLRRE